MALQTAPQPRINGNKGKRRQQQRPVEQPNQAGPSHFEDTSIAEQFGASEPLSQNEEEEAPPPSYEDVLTDNVPSVAAGGRPVYEPPITAGGSGFGDEKRRHS